MLEKIKTILEKANASYKVIFEDKYMMNLQADSLQRKESFVYIEEFTQGRYAQDRFFKTKNTQMQIYFSKFVDMHTNAIERHKLRVLIENEIVQPFMQQYEDSQLFMPVSEWRFYYPLPRWDGNEVSVMLQFDCKLTNC